MTGPDSHVDRVFTDPDSHLNGFHFDRKIAQVFDDMAHRSIPFYDEIQRMVTELAGDFVVDGTQVYDLGCSTGATLIPMTDRFGDRAHIIGTDNSQEMLDQCRAKCERFQLKPMPELQLIDFNQGIHIENASVVTMILTLQFVRPLNRELFVRNVFDGMNSKGCLILVEKVLGEDSLFNSYFIQHYYEFKKRQGYSELEISKKREALENILVPYKMMENIQLLSRIGFRSWDVFFKWYNFLGMIAIK